VLNNFLTKEAFLDWSFSREAHWLASLIYAHEKGIGTIVCLFLSKEVFSLKKDIF
jgi:hypothetical protein